MLHCLCRQQVRRLDQLAHTEFGLATLVLMENAGRGAAQLLRQQRPAGRVVVCCGPGNNGGDGLVMARHLDYWGLPVEVHLWGDPSRLPVDAAANLATVVASGIACTVHRLVSESLEWLSGAPHDTWLVDALLGTGTHGAPRGPLASVIAAINTSPARVLAVDLPSGLDCDTGAAADPTVRATLTATFVAHKPGFLGAEARAYTGTIEVVEIGAPRALVERLLAETNDG